MDNAMNSSGDNRCRIIGILDSGIESLTPSALNHIQNAELICGATRTLQLVGDAVGPSTELRDFSGQMMRVIDWIDSALEQGRKTVLLTTGDPLCHGIAPLLLKRLGAEQIELIPTLSTLQVAFSRLGMAWQQFRIASIHSGDSGEWQADATPEHGLYRLMQQIKQHDRLAIFTGPQNSPDRIARMMLAVGEHQGWQMVVAAHLQQADEAISEPMTIEDAAQRQFADPNVVILWRERKAEPPILLGLDDASYRQRKPDRGLITKQEVRAVSLAKMQLCSDSVVWDIGAGSGSIGLEAARLCSQGHVYAIEKNEPDLEIIEANRKTMAINNYSLTHAHAPAGIDHWPDADAIFIGGSGGNLALLIETALNRLKKGGRLVMNFITLENLTSAIETLKKSGAEWEVTQLSISRSKPILDMVRMAAENPVWIISVTNREHDAK